MRYRWLFLGIILGAFVHSNLEARNFPRITRLRPLSIPETLQTPEVRIYLEKDLELFQKIDKVMQEDVEIPMPEKDFHGLMRERMQNTEHLMARIGNAAQKLDLDPEDPQRWMAIKSKAHSFRTAAQVVDVFLASEQREGLEGRGLQRSGEHFYHLAMVGFRKMIQTYCKAARKQSVLPKEQID